MTVVVAESVAFPCNWTTLVCSLGKLGLRKERHEEGQCEHDCQSSRAIHQPRATASGIRTRLQGRTSLPFPLLVGEHTTRVGGGKLRYLVGLRLPRFFSPSLRTRGRQKGPRILASR